jgi:hypothetical protein
MLMALNTSNDVARIQRPGNSQSFGVVSNARFASPPQGSGGALERVSRARLKAAKRAYVTRRVSLKEKFHLRSDGVTLEAGDVVLASVVSIGQHQRIELPTGRRAELFPGDEIIVACGARYAADQFEAKVPETIGPCSLVAAGGIAAVQVNKHGRMKSATRIEIIGVLCDSAGRKINLRHYALAEPAAPARPRAQVIVVAGTSMNAGKTTTAASIIRGLRNAKLHVAACKLTGTGAGCDAWKYLDSGAVSTLDFTDAGHASTAGLAIPALEMIAATLLAASDDGADIIVAEIADGLLQAETAALLQSPVFRALIDSIVFAAGDPMSAGAGVDLLRRWGYEPAAVSGLLTASPIAIREAESVLDIPVVTAGFLQSEPDMANIVLRRAEFRGSFENARIA